MAEKFGTGCRTCQFCGGRDNLLVCSRCRAVYYCSKEHQKRHWKTHRKICGKENTDTNNTEANSASCQETLQKGTIAHQETTNNVLNRTPNWISPKNSVKDGKNLKVQSTSGDSGGKSSSERRSPPNSSKLNGTSNTYASKPQHMAFSFQQQKKVKLHSTLAEKILSNSAQCQRTCEQIISDMNVYGICVIDKFLGDELGSAILEEVKAMYNSGVFKDGQLVSNKVRDSSTTIRGDKITWVGGLEEGCAHIGDLISIVDSLIAQCNKHKNNGELGNYDIGGRTKAMVACYPGDGAHYVKHVDNPNQDGRCITSIYYLNKDWNVARGGLLRIFPHGTNQVADILPIFDRLIFFWSDRRNPHEVQASFQTRYAITLWYFDQREREIAMRRYQAQRNKLN